jgi:hypothetical protein
VRVIAISILALMFACGCNRTQTASVAPPSPGMAVVELQVGAEPKEGVKAADPNDGTYVTAVMERVDYANLPDVVVWLDAGGNSSSTAPHVSIDADGSQAATSITAVAGVGAEVSLKNKGTTAAEFYSVSDGNEFDLGKLEPGSGGTFVIKSSGLIEILTDSVRDPVARIYAAPTSLVKLTSAGQTVEFRDVKPGVYKVGTWHPRLPGHEISLNLPADQVTNAVVNVGVNGLKQLAN